MLNSKRLVGLVTGLSLGIASTAYANGSESKILVENFRMTSEALVFEKVENPGTNFYIPKSITEVRCEQTSSATGLWACSLTLQRSGVSPSTLGRDAALYPYTPDLECRVKTHPSDSKLVALLKSTAVLKIQAKGMTPSSDSGSICRFEITARGEESQVAMLEQELARQAAANELIESPIQVELTKINPVGAQLQAFLAGELSLDAGTAIKPVEASFLLGLASGRVPQVGQELLKASASDRADFYRRALSALFVETRSGLRLQSRPVPRWALYFGTTTSFVL